MKYKEQTPSSKGNHAAVLLAVWEADMDWHMQHAAGWHFHHGEIH